MTLRRTEVQIRDKKEVTEQESVLSSVAVFVSLSFSSLVLSGSL